MPPRFSANAGVSGKNRRGGATREDFAGVKCASSQQPAFDTKQRARYALVIRQAIELHLLARQDSDAGDNLALGASLITCDYNRHHVGSVVLRYLPLPLHRAAFVGGALEQRPGLGEARPLRFDLHAGTWSSLDH